MFIKRERKTDASGLSYESVRLSLLGKIVFCLTLGLFRPGFKFSEDVAYVKFVNDTTPRNDRSFVSYPKRPCFDDPKIPLILRGLPWVRLSSLKIKQDAAYLVLCEVDCPLYYARIAVGDIFHDSPCLLSDSGSALMSDVVWVLEIHENQLPVLDQ